MEDGLKIGIFAGVIIYLLYQKKSPQTPWTPPDIQYNTPTVNTPMPSELPPPNVEGCTIPPTTEGQEAILVDAAKCVWTVRTKITMAEVGTEYTYDPYLSSTSWVPVNPTMAAIENL